MLFFLSLLFLFYFINQESADFKDLILKQLKIFLHIYLSWIFFKSGKSRCVRKTVDIFEMEITNLQDKNEENKSVVPNRKINLLWKV